MVIFVLSVPTLSGKQEVICVVESIRDVIAIESTQQYNGTYHILGGVISPLDGIGPDQLNIEPLINRIEKEKIEELIFALNPNIQGDTTIYYIQRNCSPSQYPHYYYCPWHCLWWRAGICR